MTERIGADVRDIGTSHYTVETNPDFLDFQMVDSTKTDDSKPWKPALEVKVTKADGTVVEGLDAKTPFFTFKDQLGKKMTVSAEAAGHVDALHIKGINPTTKEPDPGSEFDCSSLKELFDDAATKMPEGIASAQGVSAFDVEMGKSMGKEGIASMQELVASGVLENTDVEIAMKAKERVKKLNKDGSKEDKQKFIDDFKSQNPDCKVQFQMVRGDVLVPVVDAPKNPTTKLFMVFGPGDNGEKTLYTAAPGRNMPRHPNPNQHKDDLGVINEETFNESAEAWFNTVMLTGKEK